MIIILNIKLIFFQDDLVSFLSLLKNKSYGIYYKVLKKILIIFFVKENYKEEEKKIILQFFFDNLEKKNFD
jgi:hypothetical protein